MSIVAVAVKVERGVAPGTKTNVLGECPMTREYSWSNQGHSSTMKGRSRVGSEIGLPTLKDMVRLVFQGSMCAWRGRLAKGRLGDKMVNGCVR